MIAKLTTFQNTGTVPEVIEFDQVEDLKTFILTKPQFIVLGKGSNTLVAPKPNLPPILRILPTILPPVRNGQLIRLNAGMSVQKTLSILKTEGLSGLEFSAGVPATLGGMTVMNFGCWGKSVSEFITQVRVLSSQGEDRWIPTAELGFGYRTSCFQKQSSIVLEIEFNLTPENPDTIEAIIKENIAKRLAHQPLRAKTFGSIFKNPPGKFAAQLIESCGFKGKAYSEHLKISDEHANFLVNTGQASFEDATRYMTIITKAVHDRYGITLEPEVRLLP